MRVYFGMVIINSACVLCYFVGIKITFISTGIILLLYIIYSIVMYIKYPNT